MSRVGVDRADAEKYAMGVASNSYGWYKSRAIFCRRAHWTSESLILVTTGSIPFVAAAFPSQILAISGLGSLAVILTGIRSLFHWRDNYIRYSWAREKIEAERRAFTLRTGIYAGPDAHEQFVNSITLIEQSEMSQWILVANERGTKTPTP